MKQKRCAALLLAAALFLAGCGSASTGSGAASQKTVKESSAAATEASAEEGSSETEKEVKADPASSETESGSEETAQAAASTETEKETVEAQNTSDAEPSEADILTEETAAETSAASFGVEDAVLGGRDATAENGMVAAGREDAAQVGIDILKAGGNAVDAAVAVGFALGVSEQQSSGLGGGGFMTIYLAETGQVIFLDFRDEAGAAASLSMWEKDENGKIVDQANKIGGSSVGVPGEVKGLLYALENYGTMDRQEVMQPAITMAEEGFTVSEITSRDIKDAYSTIIKFPSTMEIYLDEWDMPYEPGTVITNPDLAETLKTIAAEGESAFYTGEIAEKLVAAVQENGGCLTMEDFASYEVNVSEAVHGTYRGYDIYSSNLPSSGGTIIVEMLNILENFDVASMDPESAEYFHLLSEIMKLGFADRAAYMGDPDFTDVPVEGLTSKEYAAELAASIDLTSSQTYGAGDPWNYESDSTTSYCIIDSYGNMVAVTKTVDATFASGLVAEGTGILLNDTLYDFSTDEDSPNVVEGSKRPLSSMSPTIILKDGKPFMAVGAPGSTRIITGVFQVITKVIDHGMDIQEAIDAVRMHDDYGTLILENRVSEEVVTQLEAMGHEVNTGEVWFTYPCVQAVQVLEDGTLRGAADSRRDGIALGY